MAVARNADGRLEVFAVGTDRALIHIWQEKPGHAPWSGWESLGASIHKAPAVCRNADGRLEVFAKSFSAYPSPLVKISQTSAGRAPWSAWTSLNGRLVEAWPVVARNQQNRLEVFA